MYNHISVFLPQETVPGGQVLEARRQERGGADREHQPHQRRHRLHLQGRQAEALKRGVQGGPCSDLSARSGPNTGWGIYSDTTEFPIPSCREVFGFFLGSSPGLWAATAATATAQAG